MSKWNETANLSYHFTKCQEIHNCQEMFRFDFFFVIEAVLKRIFGLTEERERQRAWFVIRLREHQNNRSEQLIVPIDCLSTIFAWTHLHSMRNQKTTENRNYEREKWKKNTISNDSVARQNETKNKQLNIVFCVCTLFTMNSSMSRVSRDMEN